MRMAVETRRLAVSGPPSVCNAGVRVKDLLHVDVALLDELAEFGHLANLLESKHLVLLVAIDGHTSRVIATVFKTRKACRVVNQRTALRISTAALTIKQGFDDEPPVPLNQVVDIAEDATGRLSEYPARMP